MTALELYNETLMELNKLNAPTFTVEQFNYFVNKAIQAYADRRYNFYAMNQQLSDDLRVLLTTYTVPSDDLSNLGLSIASLLKKSGLTPYSYFIEGFTTVEDLIDQILVGDQLFIEGDNRLRTVIKVDYDSNSVWFTPEIEVATGGGNETDFTGVAGETSSNSQIAIGSEVFKSNQSFIPNSTLSDNRVLRYDLSAANYYHLLAVRTYWEGIKTTTNGKRCSSITSVRKMYPAKRLTYDMLANIENNSYLKPMYRQPYYLLQDNALNLGTVKRDPSKVTYHQNTPKVAIHMGKVVEGIDLISVEIDYLKLPEVVTLTEEEVYTNAEDLSQVLEWPDYLNSDLTSMIVSYFLENEMNPRIQSFSQFQQDTPQSPIEMGGQ